MDRNVLLIGNLKSYMVGAGAKALENVGVGVRRASADVSAIDSGKEDKDVFVFYITDTDEVRDDLMVYLRDITSEGNIYLMVIANRSEIQDVKRYIPESERVRYYDRPLDIKSFADELEAVFEKIESEKQKKRILVVDDNAVSLRAMKQMLSARYTVSIVNSGVSAITFLTKNEVDLILLDYEMPVVSGPQVLEMIRDEPSIEAPPVMFLTSKNDANSVKTALALKPVKYLLKSLPSSELIDAIEEFFSR